jgi:hypothetical protein
VWLNQTYSKIQRGEHLADTVPIKNVLEQGDVLSPLLFNFALECAFRSVKQTGRD